MVKKAGPAGGNPDALLDVADTFDGMRGDNPPLRLQLINCTRLHRAERDLQGDVVRINGFSYVVKDE